MSDLGVLESRLDRRLGLLGAGICAAGILLGIWLEHLVLIGFSSAGFLIGLWLVVDRRVKLRVDDVGVWYSEWGSSPVQWAEIAGLEIRAFRGTEQVCLLPRHPELLLARMPPGFRWKRTWGCRFVLSTARLEHGTPRLFEVLQHYHRARGQESSPPLP